MGQELPKKTSIVIVVGGVIGASVAWHLTEAGCAAVVILERGRLACGTTWQTALGTMACELPAAVSTAVQACMGP